MFRRYQKYVKTRQILSKWRQTDKKLRRGNEQPKANIEKVDIFWYIFDILCHTYVLHFLGHSYGIQNFLILELSSTVLVSGIKKNFWYVTLSFQQLLTFKLSSTVSGMKLYLWQLLDTFSAHSWHPLSYFLHLLRLSFDIFWHLNCLR